MWDALGDLDQVGVGGRRVGPAVDAPSERDDLPGIAEGVQAPIADAGLLGLAVGERVTQLLTEIEAPIVLTGGNHTHIPTIWVGFPSHSSAADPR